MPLHDRINPGNGQFIIYLYGQEESQQRCGNEEKQQSYVPELPVLVPLYELHSHSQKAEQVHYDQKQSNGQ